MTIAEKLEKIAEIKARSLSAIRAKGGTLSDSAPFEDYPAAIESIPQEVTEAPSGGANVYSTEETVIGTWIDGKLLYRRGFILDVEDLKEITDKKKATYNLSIENIDAIVFLDGIAFATKNFIRFNVPIQGKIVFYTALTTGTYDETNIPIDIWSSSTSPYSYITKGYLFVEYTKTTDEATS